MLTIAASAPPPSLQAQTSRTGWFFEQGQYDKSSIAYPHTKPVAAIRLKVGVGVGVWAWVGWVGGGVGWGVHACIRVCLGVGVCSLEQLAPSHPPLQHTHTHAHNTESKTQNTRHTHIRSCRWASHAPCCTPSRRMCAPSPLSPRCCTCTDSRSVLICCVRDDLLCLYGLWVRGRVGPSARARGEQCRAAPALTAGGHVAAVCVTGGGGHTGLTPHHPRPSVHPHGPTLDHPRPIAAPPHAPPPPACVRAAAPPAGGGARHTLPPQAQPIHRERHPVCGRGAGAEAALHAQEVG